MPFMLPLGTCLGGTCFGGLLSKFYMGKRLANEETLLAINNKPPACLTKAIKMSLEETGYADAKFLNEFIKLLWPRVDTYLKNLIKDKIEPSINDAMPSLMKGSVKFTKVELGQTATPKFGPLRVKKMADDSIEMQLGVDLTLDVEIVIHAASIPIGVKSLLFRGVLYNIFAPPSMKPPFFGGMQIFFANPPQIDLNFTGAANVADCPGIKGIIRNTIANAVNKKLVLPERIAVDMDQDDDVDAIALMHPDPYGILRFTLLKANNLEPHDFNMITGSKSADPYVVMQLGATPWTSKVVKSCLDPVWTEGNVKDVPIYLDEQDMVFTLYDEDWTGDDLMGTTKELPARKFQKSSGGKPVTTTVKVEPQGTLTFSTQWLVFSKSQSSRLKGPNCYLSAQVFSASGLAESLSGPYTCKISIGAHSVSTEGSSAPNVSKPLAEQARRMCIAMKKEGLTERKIADIMDIEEEQVNRAIMKDADPKKAAKLSKEVQKRLQATHPKWEQSISLLFEWSEALNSTKVLIEIVSRGKVVYTASPCTLAEVLGKSGEEVQGPFEMSGGVTIRARLHARWLDHA